MTKQIAACLLLCVFPVFPQITSVGNQSVGGKYYFVYAVWKRAESGTLMGSLQFDGRGAYSVDGKWQAGAAGRTVSTQGMYRVLPDATGQITNPMDPLLPPLSLRI